MRVDGCDGAGKETKDIYEYAAYPGIRGCQTKMLLGEYCGLQINITRAMHEEAIRRVHKMAFVGLTDVRTPPPARARDRAAHVRRGCMPTLCAH